jgi:nucleoid-associated protein YgaU
MRRKVRHALIAIAALGFPLTLVSCSSTQQGEDQLEPTNEEGGQGEEVQEGAEGEENAESAENEENTFNQEENSTNEANEGENAFAANEGEQSPEEIQEIIADMNQTQDVNQAQGNASSTEAMPEGQELAETATPAPTEPVATPSAGAAGPALPEFGSKMPYIVQSGDTLAKISSKIYGQPNRWADIAELSSLPNPGRIFPGDVVYYQLTEETLAFATKYEGLPRQEVVVGAGDTLTSISARVYGSPMDWKILWRHNDGIQNPDKLDPGTVLIYPNTSGISASNTAELNTQGIAQVIKKPTIPVMELSVQARTVSESKFENDSNLFGIFSKLMDQKA